MGYVNIKVDAWLSNHTVFKIGLKILRPLPSPPPPPPNTQTVMTLQLARALRAVPNKGWRLGKRDGKARKKTIGRLEIQVCTKLIGKNAVPDHLRNY
jgi:hypothetical protein